MSPTATLLENDTSRHASPQPTKKRKSSKISKESSKKVTVDRQSKSSKHVRIDKGSTSNDKRAEKTKPNSVDEKKTCLDLSISSGSDEESVEQGQEEEEEEVQSAKKPNIAGDRQKSPRKSVTQAAPPETSFKPPPGFQLEDSKSTSDETQLFSKSNLEGKQIWYFTAPVSLSVSSLPEISMAAILSGSPVVKHDNDEYGFLSEPTDCRNLAQVLIPKANRPKYGIVSKPVTRIMHLQRILKLPGVSTSLTAEETEEKAVIIRTARPQPKRLRMRFHPIGTSMTNPENIGSSSSSEDENSPTSDAEMEEAPSVFRPPPILPPSRKLKDKDRKVPKLSHEAQNSSHKRKQSS
ncbi:hypothetical protein K3495_g5356 [Podosphaera aphanis]|nr:hypothetical protein K3495_g5356 [Podosphaera aphanis]